MNFLFLLAFLSISGVYSAPNKISENPLYEKLNRLPKSAIEDTIGDAIETWRSSLVDPLPLVDYFLNASLPDVSIAATINGELLNFSTFNVTSINFSILRFVVNIRFYFDSILLNGTYEGGATFEGTPFNGVGGLVIDARDINVNVTAQVGLEGLSPTVNGVTTLIHDEIFNLSINGLGDDSLDAQVSDKISQDVPGLIDNNQQALSDALEPFIISIVNDLLATL